jgi:O-antigen ligase
VLLFRFDPAKNSKTSIALWIPTIALFILASRTPSQWLSGSVSITVQSVEDGDPLDRAVTLLLILAAFGILFARSFKWKDFLAKNLAFTTLLAFGLVSIIWSDFPLVAARRWLRDFGTISILLVVLSDPHPAEAIRTVLRRVCYLFIPLSVLLVKYFLDIGRAFDYWNGTGYFQGAATTKNMLGEMCLVSFLFFLWDSAVRWPDRKQRKARLALFVNALFLLMTLSLLIKSRSTTSTVCVALGSSVILGAYSKTFRRRPKLLKALIPLAFVAYLVLSFGLDMTGTLAQSVGKDPTLTDRTKIWAFLLSMRTNPMIGVGYRSFWYGPRLQYFWANSGLGQLNEAHNGFLGLYLDEGLIGVSILIVFLISSYRMICSRLSQKADIAVLGLAGWICIVFHNMSEASFEGSLVYYFFLLLGIAAPSFARHQVRRAVRSEDTDDDGSGFGKPGPVEISPVYGSQGRALAGGGFHEK